MIVAFPIKPDEIDLLCSALACLIERETRRLRSIVHRENAGKKTRVRASEQAMHLADIKVLYTRANAQRTELRAVMK